MCSSDLAKIVNSQKTPKGAKKKEKRTFPAQSVKTSIPCLRESSIRPSMRPRWQISDARDSRKDQKDSLKAFSQDESKREPPVLRFFLLPVKPARRNRQHSAHKFLSAKYRKIERKSRKKAVFLFFVRRKNPISGGFFPRHAEYPEFI